MKNLTPSEIELLARRPGARAVAVENFLGSLDMDMRERDHVGNLNADARSYKWNAATQQAIMVGIALAYRS